MTSRNLYRAVVHHRRSIRLPGYDYSKAGAYFVTICVRDRECLFGELLEGQMIANGSGRAVGEGWEWLARQYRHVDLDEWVVMPNHLHGIVVITGAPRGGSRTAPTPIRRKPLGGLIGAFKTVSTQRVNALRQCPGQLLWQRNYYEHIIRNAAELTRIREYIANNPLQWALDRENPSAVPKGPAAPWEV